MVWDGMTRILFFILILALTGCSSVPDFRPSKPVAEASSISQALDICGEYEIKGDISTTSGAEPVRVSTMTPWITCFEAVFRKFPETRQFDSFIAFFRALQARHDSAEPPDAKVVDWPEMNFAVRTILRHFKSKTLVYSKDERRAVERQLPSYGIFLAETGRFGGKPARAQFTTQDLADMRKEQHATMLGSQDSEKVPPRPVPLTAVQKEYCKRYRQFRGLVQNSQELSEYKRILDSQTYSDVTNANERAIKNRVADRYEKAKQEADQLKIELDKELPKIQTTAAWFKNGHCLMSMHGEPLRKTQ